MQLEKGEQGTPHIQGFIKYDNARHFKKVKKSLPDGAHIEVAKHPFKSWEYCTKEDTRVEGPITWGLMPKPPKRKGESYVDYNRRACTDLESMVADGTVSIKDYSKLKHSVELYKLHVDQPTTNSQLHNFWIHGSSGTGKTSSVHKYIKDNNLTMYSKPCNKWWDGYKNEDVVLIDDIGPEHSCLAHHLKIWGDHYPFTAEIKGAARQARPKTIIITSNYSPEHIGFNIADLEPIKRRYRVIEKLETNDIQYE